MPHLPFIGQDFLIDSPWPHPPASDWPAADSQATPTLPLQCDVAPLALQRRRRTLPRTPVRRPSSVLVPHTRPTATRRGFWRGPPPHSNASHGAAYPHAAWSAARPTPTRRSLAQRGAPIATRSAEPTAMGRNLRAGGAMTYLAAPPALDRPRCNLTSRQSLQLSECGRPPHSYCCCR